MLPWRVACRLWGLGFFLLSFPPDGNIDTHDSRISSAQYILTQIMISFSSKAINNFKASRNTQILSFFLIIGNKWRLRLLFIYLWDSNSSSGLCGCGLIPFDWQQQPTVVRFWSKCCKKKNKKKILFGILDLKFHPLRFCEKSSDRNTIAHRWKSCKWIFAENLVLKKTCSAP